MEFYKNKLKEKLDLIFKNKGLENNLVFPSLKHFIEKSKNKIRYRSFKNRQRDVMIDILLNNKK